MAQMSRVFRRHLLIMVFVKVTGETNYHCTQSNSEELTGVVNVHHRPFLLVLPDFMLDFWKLLIRAFAQQSAWPTSTFTNSGTLIVIF